MLDPTFKYHLLRIMRRDGWRTRADLCRHILDVDYAINERAALAKSIAKYARNSKIGFVRSGRDCDGVQYRYEMIMDVPVSLFAFRLAENKHQEWLDGPESFWFESPQLVTDGLRHSRNLTLEAYENGHPHLLHEGLI
jgi:hypothetical protein